MDKGRVSKVRRSRRQAATHPDRTQSRALLRVQEFRDMEKHGAESPVHAALVGDDLSAALTSRNPNRLKPFT